MKCPQYGPQCRYPERKKHRLSKQPHKTDIVSAIARDNFAHQQGADDPALDLEGLKRFLHGLVEMFPHARKKHGQHSKHYQSNSKGSRDSANPARFHGLIRLVGLYDALQV